MNTKTIIYTGMILGSTLGSFIPAIWGDSMFSLSSVLLSGVGGILGIVLGYKIANNYF